MKREIWYKCLKTCKDMLLERYQKIDYEIQKIDTINNKKESLQVLTSTDKNENNQIVRVIFFLGEKIGIKSVREMASVYEKDKIILVSPSGGTSFAKKAAKNIEFFSCMQVCNNPLNHILVPKHIKLSNEEKEALKHDLNFFPKLKKEDAIALFLNFKVGDIIKIERKSNSLCLSGKDYYRIVV